MLRTFRRSSFRASGMTALLAVSLGWIGLPAVGRAQYVNGIDVSYWQQSINWPAVRAAGTEFAFMRATLGVDYVDSYLNQNRTGALATGMYIGFYHYGSINVDVSNPNDAVTEANHFVNTIQPFYQQGGNLLRPVLDVETLPGLGSVAQDKAYVSQWVRNFIGVVKTRLGFDPIIYCNSNFASNYLASDLAQYDLWVANYNYAPPTIPPASIDGIWNGWDFWQYTDTGHVNGVSGNVDRNVFNGTLSEMIAKFSIGAIPKPSADFNGDGVTDGNDLMIWQRNYRGSRSGATFAMGDANGDGVVTEPDLELWKSYYGQSSIAAPPMAAVPEPTTAVLLLASALGVSMARRRR